jgi:MYXO-CTERM domain-containing protein
MLRIVAGSLAVLVAAGLVDCASNASDSSPSAARAARVAYVAAQQSADVVYGAELADVAPAHLSFALRLQDEAGLDALLRDLQDPRSPSFHAWLTPEQYGARFGLPAATYERIAAWLEGEGFTVQRYPNRLFVEATGTVAGVRSLLGVQPRMASRGGHAFRTHLETPTLPADVAPFVARIGGLDTRSHLRHRLNVNYQGSEYQVLGAADMRLEYDLPATTTAAAGLTTVVLATQEGTQASASGNPGAPFIPPSTAAIGAYFSTISNATATYKPVVLPNPNNDFDFAGSNQEYELDVEMQSVGAPNAKEIDLLLSPSSEVFMGGAQYIVNTLSSAVVVSISLGSCEPEEISGDAGPTTAGSEAYVMRKAIQQGVAEGQTWFAAAGDQGADDCSDQTSGTHNGFGGGNQTVDFPCSIPEVVCMGGSQFNATGSWNDAGALTAVQPEVVWNEGAVGGAGGGGQSQMYPKPTWQEGIGPKASDGARDVPDFSLTASTSNPGIGVYECGAGQDQWTCQGELSDAGTIDIIGGTSVASPLGAGIFARLAGQAGCRLGDVHAALYALGAAQDGGAGPFNDITSGNNDMIDPADAAIPGFAAGPGYDLASGWGTIDYVKLAAAWPACGDGGLPLSGPDGGTLGGGEDGGTSGGSSGGSSSGGASDGGGGNGASAGGGSSSSGCGCTTAGSSAEPSALGAALALGLLGAARGRRRKGQKA